MNSKIQLRVLIIALVVIGLGVALIKHFVVGYPLIPKQQIPIWTIEAKVSFYGTGEPVKLQLAVPGEQGNLGILNEYGAAQGFGYTPAPEESEGQDFFRNVTWARGKAEGYQELYYRIDVYQKPGSDRFNYQSTAAPIDPQYEEGPIAVAMESVIKEAKRYSSDATTFTSQLIQLLEDSTNQNAQILKSLATKSTQRARLLQHLISQAEYEAHFLLVLDLGETTNTQPLLPVVLVNTENASNIYTWGDPHPLDKSSLLAWQRGGDALYELFGGRNANVGFAVARQELPAEFVIAQARNKGTEPLSGLALSSLTIEQQNSYKLLLMIPFGALVVVILRNIIGIKTSGTFMPILLAMAFLQTDLLPGLILFIIVVSVGLFVRTYLSKLDLLLVPRISAVVVVVIGIMVSFGIIGTKFDLPIMQSVTLFPTIILAWTVERLSILWEEDGAHEVAIQTSGSLFVAILAYMVMGSSILRYQVFTFPELTLIVLAIILALGQYAGYRLSELIRFAPMVKQQKDATP